MNHINLEALDRTIAAFKSDPSKALKENILTGEWAVGDEGGPQFQSQLSFEKGSVTLSMDNPGPMGGSGLAPGPLQYCLFGMASCFAGTFMMVAAQAGVVVEHLGIKVENKVDMTRPLGITQNPLTDGVRITLTVKSAASKDVLDGLEEQSRQQCPAVYCLTNPIPIAISLIREG
ncbi:MAG: OsmC family protein [Leptospirales bacterium]